MNRTMHIARTPIYLVLHAAIAACFMHVSAYAESGENSAAAVHLPEASLADDQLEIPADVSPEPHTPSAPVAGCPCGKDRVFVVSTRHLPYHACRATLHQPLFRIWQIDCGSSVPLEFEQYQMAIASDRPAVIYIHGNRMPAKDVIERSYAVRRYIRKCCLASPIDWIVFSWPSDKETAGVRDFREKADRCDAQGLYLAKFLRQHTQASRPVTMIGYSFGARVATGALHALAGGKLACRGLSDPPITDAKVHVGLVAPAIESHWLERRGYHGRATQNMERLVLLYNRRDVVLKRYWLLEKVRSESALGYSGPTHFAPRADGSRLPVRSRDCSPSVKIRHSELDYYGSNCKAGCDMARLINGSRRIGY